MSVFTRQAFTMSALPTPSSSQPASAVPSRRPSFTYPASGTITPASDPHIVTIDVESVLFDMDGTLINSSPAVVEAWQLFAKSYTLDLDDILRCKSILQSDSVIQY
jgi:glycerol 3-phosphatase-1